MGLNLHFHKVGLSVCNLDKTAIAPVKILDHPFAAFIRTPDGATLVCPTDMVPDNVKTEAGWIALELMGHYSLSQIGILTQVAVPLAEAGVSIFTLSTFRTDYVLIKADKRTVATEA